MADCSPTCPPDGSPKGFDTGMGIRYYKNQTYYDEVKPLGEGCYACRCNATWHLVHV